MRVVCVGNFLPLMLFNWICHNKSESELFLYTRNLKNKRLKPAFEYKITFWIYVLVLWIHKGYCVVKKLVWNVRIKAFWYTKIVLIFRWIFMYQKSKCIFGWRIIKQKRFYTRGILRGIRISRLAIIPSLYHDWLRYLSYEKTIICVP